MIINYIYINKIKYYVVLLHNINIFFNKLFFIIIFYFKLFIY